LRNSAACEATVTAGLTKQSACIYHERRVNLLGNGSIRSSARVL
jgi:hypothetical protein